MALREPVVVAPAEQVGPVHFIAIGGAGMSGVAQLFAELGVAVSGSDREDSETLRGLAARGITTYVGHAADQLGDAETVVVSSAIRPENPELVEAHRKGLRVWHRSAALAALMMGKRGVSIAGTHGKTTTTGLTAVTLAGAGADPSYVIGAPLAGTGLSAHLGSGDAFVVEADESDGSFLQYPSEIVVVTNIEADHLDNWSTPEAYAEGFRTLCTAPTVRTVILDADDPGCRQLAEGLRGPRVVLVGESADADIRLTELVLDGASARASVQDAAASGELVLQVPGRHNLHNAVAAYAVGRALGLAPADLLAAATTFRGTHRRFEPVGEAHPVPSAAPVRVVDDYAHHPTELRAALAAARAASTGRVVACFQPHLYSRTREFAREFAAALQAADEVFVMDIYAAREDPEPGVSGRLVADAVAGVPVTYLPDATERAGIPALLAAAAQPGDLVLLLGAGDITHLGPPTVTALEARAERG